SLSQ
ncbi:hypothetical protein KKC1_27370, partial [Calderihabitans maritimus]